MTPAAVSPHASGQSTKIERAVRCHAVLSVQRALNFTFVKVLNEIALFVHRGTVRQFEAKEHLGTVHILPRGMRHL
jgi:hypothetical protein